MKLKWLAMIHVVALYSGTILLAAAPKAVTAKTQSTVTVSITGAYYYGAEVETLHPCGGTKEYWVIGSKTLLEPLQRRAIKKSKASKPYAPLYVQVVGVVGEKSNSGGFADSYDAIFHLKKVIRVSEKPFAICIKQPLT